MKVYEIIFEAPNLGPTTTTPSGIVIPQSASGSTNKPRPKRTTRTRSGTPKPKIPKASSAATTTQPAAKTSRWQQNTVDAAKVEAKWTKALGRMTVVMRVLGIATALTQLYVDLEKVDQEYQQGYMDQAEVESTREFLFGTFATQVLVPAIAKRVANALFITNMVRAIKWLAAGATGAVTGGASIVAALGTEAIFIWLQKWLGSDEGKNWLANSWLMPVIKTMGKIPEGLWSQLTGYYEKSADKKSATDGQQSNTPTQPGKPAPTTKPKPEPGTISADDFIKSLN